jgi:sortase A
MRKTAYFSLALALAAVVCAARFGARPEPCSLQATAIASVLQVTAPRTLAHTGAGQTDASSPAASLAGPTPTPGRTAPPATALLRPATRPLNTHANPVPGTRDSRPALPPQRIVASTIGLDSKIVPVGWHLVTYANGSQGTEWDVASYAVSWNKTSARLGEIGNTVLTGHNNFVGEVFRHLEDLKLGDIVTLYAGNRARQYKVTDKFILKEKDVPYAQRLQNGKWIGPFPDERITLVSCWPYTGDTHRIFIIAKPVAGG